MFYLDWQHLKTAKSVYLDWQHLKTTKSVAAVALIFKYQYFFQEATREEGRHLGKQQRASAITGEALVYVNYSGQLDLNLLIHRSTKQCFDSDCSTSRQRESSANVRTRSSRTRARDPQRAVFWQFLFQREFSSTFVPLPPTIPSFPSPRLCSVPGHWQGKHPYLLT